MRRHGWGPMGLLAVAMWTGGFMGCAGPDERGGDVTQGSGRVVEQEVAPLDFTGVHVGFGVHAEITVGSPARVLLRGDDNLLARLTPRVREGVFFLERDAEWERRPPRPTQPLLLTLVTPSLSLLRVSGGARVRAGGVEAPDFALEASGGSEVRVEGWAGQLDLEASGGSTVDLHGLPVDGLALDASGGSHVHAHVTELLTGVLSGGSRLTCEGQPASRLVSTSGGSGVNYP